MSNWRPIRNPSAELQLAGRAGKAVDSQAGTMWDKG